MISINKAPNQKILELGGGDNPQSFSDCNVDVRGGPKVHFTADFEKPLPIASDEWDCVFSHFCIEHISYPALPQFLGEVYRILKPGGKAVIITANTEAQLRWILDHPTGWDGKDMFESASCKLFGDQRHGERAGDKDPTIDSHKCYFSPEIMVGLCGKAGFRDIVIQPYGERATDMSIEATKPDENTSQEKAEVGVQAMPQGIQPQGQLPAAPENPPHQDSVAYTGPNTADLTSEQRAKLFDRCYFNGGGYKPFYWDYPHHEITARHVLERRPESVLELGCGRGYVLKRLQDAGIPSLGFDISKHCWLSCVTETRLLDLCDTNWSAGQGRDLCFSQSFLEYVPESFLPITFEQMKQRCKRGLHGITFSTDDAEPDNLRCTLRPREWWLQRLPKGHELFSKEELERGPLPADYVGSDGKVKLNIGSYMTQFHHGWTNIDQHDLKQFADTHRYHYQQVDVRNGLPYGTGTVDLIYCGHMLEHLSYKEGQSFLRECRRVLKPDGAMRLIVPDAERLLTGYIRIGIAEYDELNSGCADSPTEAGKLWELLFSGHAAAYDAETLVSVLDGVGFIPYVSPFRGTLMQEPVREGTKQILRETLDVLPAISLYVDAVPRISS